MPPFFSQWHNSGTQLCCTQHATLPLQPTSTCRKLLSLEVCMEQSEAAKPVTRNGKEEWETWCITQEYWLPPYVTVMSKSFKLHVEAVGLDGKISHWLDIPSAPSASLLLLMFLTSSVLFVPLVLQLGFGFLLLAFSHSSAECNSYKHNKQMPQEQMKLHSLPWGPACCFLSVLLILCVSIPKEKKYV